MATKLDILNNLRDYSADQIVDAIKDGTVTLYELSKSGNLTPLMRRRIEEKLAASKTENAELTSDVTSSIEDDTAFDKSDNQTQGVEISIAEDDDIPSEDNMPLDPKIIVSPAPSFEPVEQNDASESSPTMKSNKGMFRRPFSFKGRIRRTEYGITFIIYIVWYSIMNSMMKKAYYISDSVYIVYFITLVPILWFLWAEGAKRCHDRGNSGWYQLIPFYFLILLFGGGEEGSNEYGDNPKE